VWRYFFAFVPASSPLPGATHGGDESWILDEHGGAPPAQVALSQAMADWWASLDAQGDPNARARSGAPAWRPYAPSDNATAVMFMGNMTDAAPFMGADADTARVECEHWKPFLGW
jgi:carboxylesterase type B